MVQSSSRDSKVTFEVLSRRFGLEDDAVVSSRALLEEEPWCNFLSRLGRSSPSP